MLFCGVAEFGFLVIGKEFDQYPKSRIRDVKQWEWFLEDSTKGNSDDDDEDDGDKKGRKGLSKKRRRGKKRNEEDDDWSAESEEDKELIVKSKRVVSPTRDVNYRVYSTRSKKTKKDVNASSSSSSSRAQTKQRGSVDIDEEDEDAAHAEHHQHGHEEAQRKIARKRTRCRDALHLRSQRAHIPRPAHIKRAPGFQLSWRLSLDRSSGDILTWAVTAATIIAPSGIK